MSRDWCPGIRASEIESKKPLFSANVEGNTTIKHIDCNKPGAVSALGAGEKAQEAACAAHFSKNSAKTIQKEKFKGSFQNESHHHQENAGGKFHNYRRLNNGCAVMPYTGFKTQIAAAADDPSGPGNSPLLSSHTRQLLALGNGGDEAAYGEGSSSQAAASTVVNALKSGDLSRVSRNKGPFEGSHSSRTAVDTWELKSHNIFNRLCTTVVDRPKFYNDDIPQHRHLRVENFRLELEDSENDSKDDYGYNDDVEYLVMSKNSSSFTFRDPRFEGSDTKGSPSSDKLSKITEEGKDVSVRSIEHLLRLLLLNYDNKSPSAACKSVPIKHLSIRGGEVPLWVLSLLFGTKMDGVEHLTQKKVTEASLALLRNKNATTIVGDGTTPLETDMMIDSASTPLSIGSPTVAAGSAREAVIINYNTTKETINEIIRVERDRSSLAMSLQDSVKNLVHDQLISLDLSNGAVEPGAYKPIDRRLKAYTFASLTNNEKEAIFGIDDNEGDENDVDRKPLSREEVVKKEEDKNRRVVNTLLKREKHFYFEKILNRDIQKCRVDGNKLNEEEGADGVELVEHEVPLSDNEDDQEETDALLFKQESSNTAAVILLRDALLPSTVSVPICPIEEARLKREMIKERLDKHRSERRNRIRAARKERKEAEAIELGLPEPGLYNTGDQDQEIPTFDDIELSADDEEDENGDGDEEGEENDPTDEVEKESEKRKENTNEEDTDLDEEDDEEDSEEDERFVIQKNNLFKKLHRSRMSVPPVLLHLQHLNLNNNPSLFLNTGSDESSSTEFTGTLSAKNIKHSVNAFDDAAVNEIGNNLVALEALRAVLLMSSHELKNHHCFKKIYIEREKQRMREEKKRCNASGINYDVSNIEPLEDITFITDEDVLNKLPVPKHLWYHSNNLRTLQLSNTGLGSAVAIKYLAEGIQFNTSLRVLDLSRNALGGQFLGGKDPNRMATATHEEKEAAFIEFFANKAIRCNKHLEVLDLGGNGLSGNMVKALAIGLSTSVYSYRGVPEGCETDEMDGMENGPSGGGRDGEEDPNESAKDDPITVRMYHLRDYYSESDEDLEQEDINDDISADLYDINLKHPDDYAVKVDEIDEIPEETQNDMEAKTDQNISSNKRPLEPIVEALFNNETFMIPVEAPPKMTIGIPIVEEEKVEEEEEGEESDEEEEEETDDDEEDTEEEEEETSEKEDSSRPVKRKKSQGDEENDEENEAENEENMEENEETEEEKTKRCAKEKRRDEKIWKRKMEFYVWIPECMHLAHEEISARRQDLYVAYKIEMTLLKILEQRERRGPVLALERRRVRAETKRSKIGWSHLRFLQLGNNPAVGNLGAMALAKALRHNIPIEGLEREHERMKRIYLVHFIKDIIIAREKRRILKEMKRESELVSLAPVAPVGESIAGTNDEANNEITPVEVTVTERTPIILELQEDEDRNDQDVSDDGEEEQKVEEYEEEGNNREEDENEEGGPVILDERGCFNFLGKSIPVKGIIEEEIAQKGLSAMLLPIPEGLLQKPAPDLGSDPTANYGEELDDEDQEETTEEYDQSMEEARRKAKFEKRMKKLPYGSATSTRPGLRSINLLNLSDCGISGPGIKALAETIGNNCPSLQSLNLSLNPHFSLKQRRNIDEEYINENENSTDQDHMVNRANIPVHFKYEIETVTPATLSLKTCISLNETLTTLDLSFCGLYPASIKALAEGFGINRTLKHLNLRGNFIGYIIPATQDSKRKPILPPTSPNEISTLSVLLDVFTDEGTNGPSSLQTLILDQNCLGSPPVSKLVTCNNPDYVVTGVKEETTYTEEGEKITKYVDVIEKAPQVHAFDQRAATLLAHLCNNSLDRLSIAGNDLDNDDMNRFSNAIFEFVMDKKLGSASVRVDVPQMGKESIPVPQSGKRPSITEIKEKDIREMEEKDNDNNNEILDHVDENTDPISDGSPIDFTSPQYLRKPIMGHRNGSTPPRGAGVSFCVNTTATLQALNIGNNPRLTSECGTALARLLQFMSRLQELLVYQCPGIGNEAFKLVCLKIYSHPSLKVLSFSRTGITTLQPLIDALNTKKFNLAAGTDKKPLHLTVLDLSDNDLNPSSVEELCRILADNVVIHVDSQNTRSRRSRGDYEPPQFSNSVILPNGLDDNNDDCPPPCSDPYGEEDVTPTVSMERRASQASSKFHSRCQTPNQQDDSTEIKSPTFNITSLAPMLRYISIWSRRHNTSDAVCSVPTTILASISRLVHAGLLDDFSCALTSRDGGILSDSILAGAGAISPHPLSQLTSILQARGLSLLFKPSCLNRSDEGFNAAAVVGLLSLLSPPQAPTYGMYYPHQEPCDPAFAQIPSVAYFFAALLDRIQHQYILKNRLNRLNKKHRELEEQDIPSGIPTLEDLISQDQEQLKNSISEMLVSSGDNGQTATEKASTAMIERLLLHILAKQQMVMHYLVTILRSSKFKELGHNYICAFPENEPNSSELISIDYPPPQLPTYRPRNISRGTNLSNKSILRDYDLEEAQDEQNETSEVYQNPENDESITLNSPKEEQKMETLTKELNKLYSQEKNQDKQYRKERLKTQRNTTRGNSVATETPPMDTSDHQKSNILKRSAVSLKHLLRSREERARDTAITTEAQALSVGSLLLLLVPTIRDHLCEDNVTGEIPTGDSYRSVTDVLSWQCLINRLS